jgi:Ca-activated chloride channel family protein
MAKRHFVPVLLFAGFVAGSAAWLAAQESVPSIRVAVDLVQLDVAVTDNKGEYVTGLQPSDFVITEDKIPQKLAVFGEGDSTPQRLAEIAPADNKKIPGEPVVSADASGQPGDNSLEGQTEKIKAALTGANVFILFDTSSYMYRGFVYAQDAISNFVRSLDGPDRVAFYAYSRDLYRASALTPDRVQVLRGIRDTTAGDNAALYNSLLTTLKDAGQFSGRKAIVVFSNGPDNASMVPPEDIRELAQSLGIPIYMISTREAKLEPVSTAVFERMSSSTGGQAYFAKDWQEEQKAFNAIRNDLAHIYSIYYYPEANPNHGWRAITVKIKGNKKYNIRTRSGYRPQPAQNTAEVLPLQ